MNSFLVISILFIVLPVIAGSMAHYTDRARYLELMSFRRSFDLQSWYLVSVGICITVVLALYAVKLFSGANVAFAAYTVFSLLLFLSLVWVYLEFPIRRYWTRLKYWIISAFSIVSLIVAFYSQLFIDELVTVWTGYQSADFSTSQIALTLVVVPAVWIMVICFLLLLVYVAPMIMLISGIVKLALFSTAFGRSVCRFVINDTVRAIDVDDFQRKLFIRGAALMAIHVSFQVLPTHSLSYLASDKFENQLKQVFLEGAYYSDASLCENIDNALDVKIALLSKDRISIYKEGDVPEFSKGKCTFSQSRYITASKADS
ncbi:hypothetical protein RAL01_000616 [Vibrio vulnificus]|uniref:hypothetical protein n=1 Tax=Vibrio vulnificus TaxID=672 RepID=UPI00102947A6|nr:hypothetical protein [Vibrio vulnificus]EGQ8022026.1 hypothetical protein [Vibrio vulnificus]EJN6709496.1 hypothetical protein [Vibrio vulnificus]ELG4948431.1 hypothetical protein [Vibrio vulnificus]RZQ77453.1 hypothetical protein D8T30_04000 [Vibrio vulnificus]RZR02507.1 hypothetical protein D8T29_03875 [Vibrio vulnificus]